MSEHEMTKENLSPPEEAKLRDTNESTIPEIEADKEPFVRDEMPPTIPAEQSIDSLIEVENVLEKTSTKESPTCESLGDSRESFNEFNKPLVPESVVKEPSSENKVLPETVEDTSVKLSDVADDIEHNNKSPLKEDLNTPAQNTNLSETTLIKSITDCEKLSPKEPKDSDADTEYAEHVTYTDDGTAIYTDPKTQYRYKWCETKADWVPVTEADTNPTGDKSNPYENEHYRWCSETNQWIPKSSAAATSSQTETEHYRWDAEKNEWILKSQAPVSLDDVTYGYEDGVRIYTDKDGAVFFWDVDKKAWFPKIDDDFMARYQMNYGFLDNTSVAVTPSTTEEKKEEEAAKVEEAKKADAAAAAAGGVKRKAPPEPPKWFELDPTQNTKVYVSNLPLDVTMEEFAEIMSKCGMIMRDPQTQKQKLKLYTESDGQIKGDGLCDYIKVESVDLALKLLDESVIRGNKIRVQRAKFQMRGEYDPTLKPKRKKKDKEKLAKMKEKLFDWRPEKMRGERSKHEKIVIIKNLFTPDLFDKEVQLIIDYQNDLREECSKCGTVRKVVIFDRHVDGVAQINMADPDQADLVVQMMNGRFFGKRKLIAEIWDGKTKYKVAETEKEVQDRLKHWDKYLTEEEKVEKLKGSVEVSDDATETSSGKTLESEECIATV